MLQGLFLDLRYAIRSYGRRPAFTVAAVLMLALGIGANTAIFSVAYAVLLKPLSYPEPDRLVSVWPETPINKMIADEAARRVGAFSAVSAYMGREFPLSGDGDPVIVKGAQVGTRHFDVLRGVPRLGRTFTPDESRPGQHRVTVLSHDLWRSRFGGDPAVVGKSIDLNGERFTVVGVMPEGFQPLEPGWQLWVPLQVNPGDPADYFGSFYLKLVGRLGPGVSAERAQAEVARLAGELRTEQPNMMTEEKVQGARVAPLHEHIVGKVRSTLMVLLVTVGVVLLIACGNVASLLLARAAERRREVAVRAALGAAPGRVARQVFTESVLLGITGGAAGVLVAALTLRVLVSTLPGQMPRAGEVGLSAPVLAFALLSGLVSALLFGMAPASRAARVDVQAELKEEGGGAGLGRKGRRAGRLLVAAQVAGVTVLIITAGLLAKSLGRLQSVDPGFRTDGLLTLRLDLVDTRYPQSTDKIEYYRRVEERVRAVPGVSGAAAIHLLPLTTDNWNFPYLAEGFTLPANAPAGTSLPEADFRVVTPDYFGTMRIQVLRGRALAASDHAEAPAVGVISRALAERMWPTTDPVGRTIQLFGQGGPVFTVVGVVDDIHPERLDAPTRPTIYRPFAQWPNGSMYMMVRTATPVERLATPLRSAIWEIDPSVPVSQMRSMDEVVRTSLADARFTSFLIAGFAGLALLLALMGVYGVISHALARRTRELGIRMALGARREDVFRLVMGEGVRLTIMGVALGVLAAFAATRVVSSRLYQVSTTDGATFAAGALFIAVAALVSCGLPAWRATRVDPALAVKRD
jgi:putative ABC transport system permease protein